MITRSSLDRRGLPGRVRRLSWLKATDSSATGGVSAAMAPAISTTSGTRRSRRIGVGGSIGGSWRTVDGQRRPAAWAR